MTMRSKSSVLITLIIVLMAACAPVPTQTVETVEATATVKPNLTSTPSITKTPFQTRTPEADIAIFEESTSPDGAWMATITRTIRGKNYNLNFIVSNNQNNQTWVIENLDFIEPENPLSGYEYPYIFKWSNDGNYLYYSHLSTGGDGCFGHFQPGGSDLKRFDLSSSDIATIRNDGATWMAISPDEKKLAYINTWGGNVTILDMESGNERQYPLPAIKNDQQRITDTSDIYWSPDGKSLVYGHYIGVCDFLLPFSYIIQIYPDTNQQRILVENSDQGYFPSEWIIPDRILLTNIENNSWWLNPITKEITPTQ